MKQCSLCKINKPFNYFAIAKRTKSGYVSACKECTRNKKQHTKKYHECSPDCEIKFYTCSKCKQLLPLINYPRTSHRPNGHTVTCRNCCNNYHAERRTIPKTLPAFKTCFICKKEYESANFSINNSQKDGLAAYCRPCNNVKKKESRYKTKIEVLQKMIKEQDGKCLICNQKFSTELRMNVDHCHKTKVIRGILCVYCNYGLGNFKDNIEYLEQAIKYLSESATKVL